MSKLFDAFQRGRNAFDLSMHYSIIYLGTKLVHSTYWLYVAEQ